MKTIRTARPDERCDLNELQRRESLANPGDRDVLLEHPEVIDTPAERGRADGVSALHVIGNPHAAQFYLEVGFVPLGPADTEFGPATAYTLRLT